MIDEAAINFLLGAAMSIGMIAYKYPSQFLGATSVPPGEGKAQDKKLNVSQET